MESTDVLVIGGGPAGLAAAVSAHKHGAEVMLVEREARLGGILKQCIHDGFGMIRFGEKLSGPEYAGRWIDMFHEAGLTAKTSTFVTKLEKTEDGFTAHLVSASGIDIVQSKALILATGCRERTAKQVFIHGTRPAGIFTAGSAQHFINLMGQKIGREAVILGSGDIGLIMARRLTLEGAHVIGVYEVKDTPSGLTRNIHQCLDDFGIPLTLSHTVTRVFGTERLTAVEICAVDEKMKPIKETAEIIPCDTLILSVGLIPENELAESLGVGIDKHTKGPLCDGHLMSDVPGVFSCGNALHVNDLVDYVSESGETAGRSAAEYAEGYGVEERIPLEAGRDVAYIVPQCLRESERNGKITVYFRTKRVMDNAVLKIKNGNQVLVERPYAYLRPPEMQRLIVNLEGKNILPGDVLTAEIEGDGK